MVFENTVNASETHSVVSDSFIIWGLNHFYILWKWKLLNGVWLFVIPWTIQSMEFSRENTEVGSLSLLQGISPIQGLNPGLPHYRCILHQLSHKGSPRILEWIAYPFSSGSSQSRNQTGSPALQANSLPTELSGKPLKSKRVYLL